MKKTLFLFAFIAVTAFAKAQINIGIKAGLNQSELRVNSNEGSFFSNNHYKSFHAGLVTELELGSNLSLQPQFLYSRKGATLQSSLASADRQVRIDYIEVPVFLMYKLDLPFGKVFGGAGPGFSYAFGGKIHEGAGSTKLFGGNDKNWRREDISLNFTAGLQFNNGLFLSVNSQKGLHDIYKSASTSIKNRSMSVSVGYLINWKKPSDKKS